MDDFQRILNIELDKQLGEPRAVKYDIKFEERIEVFRDIFADYMAGVCDVPAEFEVAEEYLSGLSRSEFCRAYFELRETVVAMYEALAENPRRLIVSNDTLSTAKVDAVFKFLYTTGRVGVFDADRLVMDRKAFLNLFMTIYKSAFDTIYLPRYHRVLDFRKKFKNEEHAEFYGKEGIAGLFTFLRGFGFMVEDEGEAITVRYLKSPGTLQMLKGIAKHSIFVHSFKHDFRMFNWRVFATPSNNNYFPVEDLYTFGLLNGEAQEVLSKLNSAMNQKGVLYREAGGKDVVYRYNYAGVLIGSQKMDGTILFRLKPTGKSDWRDRVAYFETIPQELGIKIGICSGCSSSAPEQECKLFRAVEIHGKNVGHCISGRPWKFPSTLAALPYLLEAYDTITHRGMVSKQAAKENKENERYSRRRTANV